MTKITLSRLAPIACLATLAWAPLANAHALPQCDDGSVLAKVNRQLLIAEKNVVQSGDPVIEIKRSRQTKLRDKGPRAMAQRYCRAKGVTRQGRKKTVFYLIEEHAGFASIGYGVEACISNRDPWKVHGAYCRSVR